MVRWFQVHEIGDEIKGLSGYRSLGQSWCFLTRVFCCYQTSESLQWFKWC